MRKYVGRFPLQNILTVPLMPIVLVAGWGAGALAFWKGRSVVDELAHQVHQRAAARVAMTQYIIWRHYSKMRGVGQEFMFCFTLLQS
jgi:hypothetical protein